MFENIKLGAIFNIWKWQLKEANDLFQVYKMFLKTCNMTSMKQSLRFGFEFKWKTT